MNKHRFREACVEELGEPFAYSYLALGAKFLARQGVRLGERLPEGKWAEYSQDDAR